MSQYFRNTHHTPVRFRQLELAETTNNTAAFAAYFVATPLVGISNVPTYVVNHHTWQLYYYDITDMIMHRLS